MPENRWLLTLDIGGRMIRLSDLAGEVEGDLYRQGIAAVTFGEAGIDVEGLTATVPDASVELTPDVDRIFDPRVDLPRAKATLSLLVDDTIVASVAAKVTDVEIGRSSDLGEYSETHSFRIIEEFKRNPLVPAEIVTEKRFGRHRMDPAAEGRALTQVYGDVLTVPMFPVRTVLATGGRQYLVCGHSLREGRPNPQAGMPWNEFPQREDLSRNQVVGQWYARNRTLRDSFRDSSINAGWAHSANVTEGTTGIIIPSGSNIRWKEWTFIQPLSWGIWVANDGAGSGVDRGFRWRWGWNDSQNYIETTFNIDANSIVVDVYRGGTAGWTSDTITPSPALVDTITEYRLIVSEEGEVTIAVADARYEIGIVPGVHHGHILFTSDVEQHRFTGLRMPHETARDTGVGDLNAGLKTFDDKLGDAYVVEEYDEEVSTPLYAETWAAQNVQTAGELYRALATAHSGYDAAEIDERSFEQAGAAMKIRCGAYFTAQEPLFDIVRDRLAPQFLGWIVQTAGKLTAIAMDPTATPAVTLRVGRDLLEMSGPIRVLPRYTHFSCRYRWRENMAGGPGFLRRRALGPDQMPVLLAHELRNEEKQYETLDLIDVIHDASAEQILARYAALFWQGEEVSYLRRAVPNPLPYGTMVELSDEPNGYDRQRAVLLRRRYDSPDFMVETFRTVHPLEDSVVAGTPETVVVETTLLISEGWDVDLVTPTQTLISEGWES